MSDFPNFDRLFTLEGKTALVTGGSRGLGLHIATAFLRAGCSLVIVTARKLEGEQGINQAVDKLNQLPNIRGRAVGLAANVGSSDDIVKLVAEVSQLVGSRGLNILVNNAGASWGSRFEDAPPESSVKILDLNVRGVFELTQKALPLLAAAATAEDPARVVTVSSTAALNVPHVGEHGTIMYSASKAAAHHLGRNLAVELGPHNITSNVIAPGFFPSKLAQGLIQNLGGEEKLSRGNPMGRLGEPEDIAGVAIYLCSHAGRYVNGVDIPVDGGVRLASGRFSRKLTEPPIDSAVPTDSQIVTGKPESAVDISSFTSQESDIDTSLAWESFKHPKLHKFPHPAKDLHVQEFLGSGYDGAAFRARIGDEIVVLKAIRHSKPPKRYGPRPAQYWAFQRECTNWSILNKVRTRLRLARESGKPVFVHPRPSTRKEAFRNLKAFSDEGVVDVEDAPEDFEPLPLDLEINVNPCLGWVEVPGSQIEQMLRKCRSFDTFQSDESYFGSDQTYHGLVYHFVPGTLKDLDEDELVMHAKFFQVIGFTIQPFRHPNWKGKSVLVDFSDLRSPFRQWEWRLHDYQLDLVGNEPNVRMTLKKLREPRQTLSILDFLYPKPGNENSKT